MQPFPARWKAATVCCGAGKRLQFCFASVASCAAGKVSGEEFSRGLGSVGSRFPSSPQTERVKPPCSGTLLGSSPSWRCVEFCSQSPMVQRRLCSQPLMELCLRVHGWKLSSKPCKVGAYRPCRSSGLLALRAVCRDGTVPSLKFCWSSALGRRCQDMMVCEKQAAPPAVPAPWEGVPLTRLLPRHRSTNTGRTVGRIPGTAPSSRLPFQQPLFA